MTGSYQATRKRRVFGVLATAAVLTAAVVPAAGAAQGRKAPLVGTERASAIDGRYIVVLKDQTSASGTSSAKSLARSNGGRVTASYSTVIRGFAASLPDRALDKLRANPDVAYIEADQRVSIDATQTAPTWGLDRIDQRDLPLSSSYTYNATGAGVTAYIIDTGIRATHSQFGGRVLAGYTAINDG
jgi:subtilisin family serine protease